MIDALGHSAYSLIEFTLVALAPFLMGVWYGKRKVKA